MTVKMFIGKSTPDPALHILSDNSVDHSQWNHIYVGPHYVMSNIVDYQNSATQQILSGLTEVPEHKVTEALFAIREVLINHE